MTIGKLAKRAGVHVETVRYYERRGLMPKPNRRLSGYRQYTDKDLERLLFIREAKNLGFSLDEVSQLLSLRVDPVTNCRDVKRLAQAKIEEIETKIAAFQKIKEALTGLVLSCESGPPNSECPILEALEPKRFGKIRS
ncbi:MAG: heavy metal-responsive transcriptional regulator [Deltaproteobacteria bacterium]|nr:heavy metal-responsive transcriptional regulator [Deltaproteobacteria bacterium]